MTLSAEIWRFGYSKPYVMSDLIQNIWKTSQIRFVCIVALRPKSTAKVIAGRSVHLYTLFPGQALPSD